MEFPMNCVKPPCDQVPVCHKIIHICMVSKQFKDSPLICIEGVHLYPKPRSYPKGPFINHGVRRYGKFEGGSI